MSIDDLLRSDTVPRVPGTARRAVLPEIDVIAEARELVEGLLAEPWGQVSASPYETGRLVSLTPWLAGHARRVGFLLAAQRPDGGWGAPGGYALVPTLSATEALLAETRREPPGHGGGLAAVGARRGLGALRRWRGGPVSRDLPDMPAIELIVPALTAMINNHLEALGERRPLEPPAGMDGAKLSMIRARLASGATVPRKLLHALEVAGETAAGAAGVTPCPIEDFGALPEVPSARSDGDPPGGTEPSGPQAAGEPGGARAPTAAAVGASPAAGAAWLGEAGAFDGSSPVRRYLEAVVNRSGGPVPCAIPVTVFERGWTLSWLRRAGIPVTVPGELVESLERAIGPGGTAAGAGLPPDSDTTSVGLYALALLGVPREPGCLWAYEVDTHFCTWQGEEGASPTVNAHVLDAFGEHLRRTAGLSGDTGRYAIAVGKLSAWLRGCQRADGSWMDRWHASPYYATACCALALEDYGGEGAAGAVRGAVRWLLDTQREDGSWGRWAGTAEETAYALQTLLLTDPSARPGSADGPAPPGPVPASPADPVGGERRARAVERGYRSLLDSVTERGAPIDAPALWHDKDLYVPGAIVRAAILGALHLARRALSLPAPVAPSSTLSVMPPGVPYPLAGAPAEGWGRDSR